MGHHCWLAEEAWIDNLAPNAEIGPGAVVALGAGVRGTVPAGAIVRGNPAVLVGRR